MKGCLKFIFYDIFCPFLLFIGVDKFLRRISKHQRLVIMYHGVCVDNSTSINGRHLPVKQFERHLRYFKKNFNIISLADLCEMKLKGIQPQKHTIALTFDDGYLNNISNALPLLKKYRIPATFFISTASLEEPDYIHPSDYLDLVNFFIEKEEEVEINRKIFKKGKYHLIDSERKSNIYEFVNSMDFSLWKKTFSDLHSRYSIKDITRNVNDSTYKLITGSALSGLQRSDLIAVGAHGHWHINLTMLSVSEINDQLVTSQECFSKHSLKPIESLAFPFGYFNEEVLSLSRKLGYKYLIAGGHVTNEYKNRVFPRIGILNLGSFAYNTLSINGGFNRFGF